MRKSKEYGFDFITDFPHTIDMKELSKKEEQFASLLREAGFKATPSRLALLALLDATKKPLSIKDIQGLLKKDSMDQATVYRIVKALKGIGVIRQVDFQHTHAHYELVHSVEDHHHLICTSCGKYEDITDCNLDVLAAKTLKQSKQFASIDHHSLEFFGLCSKCNRKK